MSAQLITGIRNGVSYLRPPPFLRAILFFFLFTITPFVFAIPQGFYAGTWPGSEAATPEASCQLTIPLWAKNNGAVGLYYVSTDWHPEISAYWCEYGWDTSSPSSVARLDYIWHHDSGCLSGYVLNGLQCVPPHDPKTLGAPPCNGTNPINGGTGNKYQVESDYRAGPFQLVWERYYNGDSQVNINSASLGSNWRGTYDRSISAQTTTATVYRPDGKSVNFQLSNGSWISDVDVLDRLQQNSTGWTYTTADDAVETYDSTGKLLSITNRAGLTQTLTYSDGTTGVNGGYILNANGTTSIAPLRSGLLIRITNTFGRTLTLGYDNSRIVKMTDPAGGIYLYAYDTNSNLTSVTYPDGKTKTNLYGEPAYTSGATLPHALTGIIDENNVRYATYRYDSTGLAYDEDHGGTVDHYNLAYTADSSGNPISTTVTDPLGTSRTYNFTTVLGVVKSTGTNQPGGSGCGAAASNVTFDANGNISSRTDFNGNKTTYLYDLTRNLETSRTEAAGTSVARTITTTWHPTFRLPTQIAEPGRVTNLAYDTTTGNLLNKSITDTVSNTTRTWTNTYTTTADGTLAGLLKTVDGPRTDVSDVTSYAYYANGDLKTVTNALGHVTQITSYDPTAAP
jgi:YD repeat-containing protein